MTDDEKAAPQAQEPKQPTAEPELSDAELGDVSGGINPQPLPPFEHLPT